MASERQPDLAFRQPLVVLSLLSHSSDSRCFSSCWLLLRLVALKLLYQFAVCHEEVAGPWTVVVPCIMKSSCQGSCKGSLS